MKEKIQDLLRSIKAEWRLFRMSKQDMLDAQERGRNGWYAR